MNINIWTKAAAAIATAKAKELTKPVWWPICKIARSRLRRNIRSKLSQNKDRCTNIWDV
jgi:hypothetical protein